MDEIRCLLGFADRRPSKLRDPLNSIDGANVIAVENKSGAQKYMDLINRGKKKIRSLSPDILISNHPGRLGATVLSLGAVYGIPVVIRIAGDMWATNREKMQEDLSDQNYIKVLSRAGQLTLNEFNTKKSHGFLTVSEELREIIIRRANISPQRVQVIPVPINQQQFRSEKRKVGEQTTGVRTEQTLLTVTNLRFQGKFEGVCDSIREITPILVSNSDITYIIAGGGHYLSSLEHYVTKYTPTDIRDQIVITGHVDNVRDLYAVADVFIYISYIDGCPNVVSEAMAAGLPVVANAAHGMIEQVSHGETGLLVQSPDSSELTVAVNRLLTDHDLANEIGLEAQKQVKTQNHPDKVGKEMLTALNSMIGSSYPSE